MGPVSAYLPAAMLFGSFAAMPITAASSQSRNCPLERDEDAVEKLRLLEIIIDNHVQAQPPESARLGFRPRPWCATSEHTLQFHHA